MLRNCKCSVNPWNRIISWKKTWQKNKKRFQADSKQVVQEWILEKQHGIPSGTYLIHQPPWPHLTRHSYRTFLTECRITISISENLESMDVVQTLQQLYSIDKNTIAILWWLPKMTEKSTSTTFCFRLQKRNSEIMVHKIAYNLL